MMASTSLVMASTVPTAKMRLECSSLIRVGTADTAWAKLVGAGFFKVGVTLFLMSEVEEFN